MAETKGILGTKLGMTQIFTDDARALPVTVIQAGPCVVTQVRTDERDGYRAVQLAYLERQRSRVSKPMAGHFKAANAKPASHLVEFRTDAAATYTPGQRITVDIFQPGERADVVGVSKGKGFAGT
ncbi:MAG: 50S ribosomal protein L3, partial [Actinobacteria bacterium]|nr:50S ribosomal protein L3 [Actinomycetota bacterium]